MLVFQEMISRNDLKNNPQVLYVFGDNDQRRGLGGQAKAMRGEPNAVGVRTKKLPSNQSESFYTDDEYADNIQKIDEDFMLIEHHLSSNGIVVFPSNGIGGGLADLPNKAPKTYEHIRQKVIHLKKMH